MKARILNIIILLLLPEVLLCQDYFFENYNNTFGLKASNISGYGIYYHRKITDDLRVQLMGLAFYLYSKDEGLEHKNFNYDIGIELQQDIAIGNNLRVYGLVGAFYYLDDDMTSGQDTLYKSLNHSFNIGVGLGGLYFYKRFVFSLEFGYKFFEDNLEITMNERKFPRLNRVTKLGAGIGVGFMF